MITIDKLPAGVRIKLLSISEEDAFYTERKTLEGKNFVAYKQNENWSTWFIMEGIGRKYCFYSDTTYEILKPTK